MQSNIGKETRREGEGGCFHCPKYGAKDHNHLTVKNYLLEAKDFKWLRGWLFFFFSYFFFFLFHYHSKCNILH